MADNSRITSPTSGGFHLKKLLHSSVEAEALITALSLATALICIIAVGGLARCPAKDNLKSNIAEPTFGFYDIGIEVDASACDALRSTPRSDVDGVLAVSGLGQVSAKLHLKGHGSFQTIDNKPNFTCKLRHPVVGAAGPMAVTKFHLHNNAQDPSLIADFLARKVYRRLGIPAGQIAFARVSLNGRPLGLYTVTEGITHTFLASHYGVGSGRLIEGEEGDEVTGLVLKSTSVTKEQTFCEDSAIDYRNLLKVEDLRAMIAAECLCANRDGYIFGRNNYWIYQAKFDEPWRIFPHTADGAFSFDQTGPMMVPVASLATDLLTDESQRSIVLDLLREQTAPEKGLVRSRWRRISAVLAHQLPLGKPLVRFLPFNKQAHVVESVIA